MTIRSFGPRRPRQPRRLAHGAYGAVPSRRCRRRSVGSLALLALAMCPPVLKPRQRSLNPPWEAARNGDPPPTADLAIRAGKPGGDLLQVVVTDAAQLLGVVAAGVEGRLEPDHRRMRWTGGEVDEERVDSIAGREQALSSAARRLSPPRTLVPAHDEQVDLIAEVGQPCARLAPAVYGPGIDVPGIVGDRLRDRLACRQLGVVPRAGSVATARVVRSSEPSYATRTCQSQGFVA